MPEQEERPKAIREPSPPETDVSQMMLLTELQQAPMGSAQLERSLTRAIKDPTSFWHIGR